jgi:hypothetical protein
MIDPPDRGGSSTGRRAGGRSIVEDVFCVHLSLAIMNCVSSLHV